MNFDEDDFKVVDKLPAYREGIKLPANEVSVTAILIA